MIQEQRVGVKNYNDQLQFSSFVLLYYTTAKYHTLTTSRSLLYKIRSMHFFQRSQEKRSINQSYKTPVPGLPDAGLCIYEPAGKEVKIRSK